MSNYVFVYKMAYAYVQNQCVLLKQFEMSLPARLPFLCYFFHFFLSIF